MDFFKYYRRTPYTFDVDGDTFQVNLTNVTQRAKIVERLRQYTSAMYEYVIQDGERPDIVAQRLYGSPSYTWVVLLSNNIFSLYDWPLSSQEFEDYLISKYGSIQHARDGARTYYTVEGDRVDETTYDALPEARQGNVLTPYEQEVQDNEAKRRIKVIRGAFLPQIFTALKTLFK